MTVTVTPVAPATAPVKAVVLAAPEAVTPYPKPYNNETYKPTHPGRFRVVFDQSAGAGESFSSKLVAERDYAPGETLALLDNKSAAPVKAYSSVQYGAGPNDHLELNSDLLFMNHSCAPTVEMVLPSRQPERWEVRVGPAGVKKGGDLTFFYPSTEWDMAQGFTCSCGAKTHTSQNCLGEINGAKYLTLEQLEERGLVNDHIRALKAGQ
ncbi:hypothetical protein VHUM_03693 [Vanrija humicola]|uniref:SET domain-containing protein n=1 Tax=Vanrija humicola TaxID=5417 RepID=A0A7D8UZ94_VANHU|nr:hypothetical protein VHUM_03693 [Vanrija humicola]